MNPLRFRRLLWMLARFRGDEDADNRVFAEQVALLYQQAPLAYIVTAVNGSILVFVQKDYIENSILLGWLGTLLLVTTGRAMLVVHYTKSTPRAEKAGYWQRRYIVGVVLAGMVWGASAIALFPVQSLLHQVFLAFVLTGMSAAGVAVLAARLEASLLFLGLTLLPLAIQCFRLGSELQTAMGIMTVIFIFGMATIARTMHRAIYTSFCLRFDNRSLQQEIRQRRSAEENVYQEKERLQITLATIDDGVVITDAQTRIVYCNPAAERLSALRSESLLQQPLAMVFRIREERSGQQITSVAEECLRLGQQVMQSGLLQTAEGSERYVETLANPLYGRHGASIGVVCVFRDVTYSRRQTARLVHEAQHDSLTGLPNRNLLNDRLHQALVRAQRAQQQVAVLFIDLDRFKQVNDEYGHEAGDLLLKQAAIRLHACVRAEDTVARLGGDEFVVIIERLGDAAAALAVADKILLSLAEVFVLGERQVSISASIGISVFPDHATQVGALLRTADQAMYRAKEKGCNQSCFFSQLQ